MSVVPKEPVYDPPPPASPIKQVIAESKDQFCITKGPEVNCVRQADFWWKGRSPPCEMMCRFEHVFVYAPAFPVQQVAFEVFPISPMPLSIEEIFNSLCVCIMLSRGTKKNGKPGCYEFQNWSARPLEGLVVPALGADLIAASIHDEYDFGVY